MNNILSFNISTPNDISSQIASRVKARRLELNLTQEGLATRAGLKFATYRRFEQTGEISLHGLLQIAFALNALSDFDILFSQREYQSIDEVLKEQKKIRKRGKNMKNNNETKRILITAGPTNEYIDEVMKITNMSTGRLGIELTNNYLKNGDNVTLIATRSVFRGGLFERYDLANNPNLKGLPIETTDDMFLALEKFLEFVLT